MLCFLRRLIHICQTSGMFWVVPEILKKLVLIAQKGFTIRSTRQPQGPSQRKGPIGKVAWGQERQAASAKRLFFLTVGHFCDSESKLVCFISTLEKNTPVLEMLPSIKIHLQWGKKGSSSPSRRKHSPPTPNFLICYFPVWVYLIPQICQKWCVM